jgi:hypothetical protein
LAPSKMGHVTKRGCPKRSRQSGHNAGRPNFLRRQGVFPCRRIGDGLRLPSPAHRAVIRSESVSINRLTMGLG